MARKSKLNAGVIGLGIIGSRIASNLRNKGFQVYVWNRTPKPAPNFLASAAEVAGICDIIQIVVADTVALFTVIDAMSSALTKRHTVVCSATVGSEATLEAARMVALTGAKFLDAPFTGSKGAAEKGELVYYIGGDDETFQKAEPMLKATSKTIVRVGEIGHAATIKIATNMIAAVTVQGLAEACVIVKKRGIDPRMLAKALEPHGVRSALLDMKLPALIESNYETNFSVKHMFKDMQLAIRVANNADIDIPATTATAGVLYSSINNGWAELDYAAVGKFYEDPEKTTSPDDTEQDEEPETPSDALNTPEKPETPDTGEQEEKPSSKAEPNDETSQVAETENEGESHSSNAAIGEAATQQKTSPPEPPSTGAPDAADPTGPAAEQAQAANGHTPQAEEQQPRPDAQAAPAKPALPAATPVPGDKAEEPRTETKPEKSKGWFSLRRQR